MVDAGRHSFLSDVIKKSSNQGKTEFLQIPKTHIVQYQRITSIRLGQGIISSAILDGERRIF